MDDRQDPQLERFREAVDRKSEEAREASHQQSRPPADADGPIDGGEQSLYEHGRPQDTLSQREKNAGKGKKTADKWNQ